MEQEILTPLQKQVLKRVSEAEALSDFYLSGGTALAAFYLHHRYSDDLDFFSPNEVDGQFIESFMGDLKKELSAKEMGFERLYDRRLFFLKFENKDILKLEFTKYPFHQFEEPKDFNGVRVDSLKDIAANKLMAFADRFDPKDFVDLYYILQEHTLKQLRTDAEKKFGTKLPALFLGGQLARVKRIEALPKMLKLLTPDELKIFFEELAKSLREEIGL